MLAWMLYVIMVTLLLSFGALLAERAARLQRGRSRWIWIMAIVASLALPTVIASVTLQLPNVMSAAVAEKVVVLREATTQALSPVMWISGSAANPPAGATSTACCYPVARRVRRHAARADRQRRAPGCCASAAGARTRSPAPRYW